MATKNTISPSSNKVIVVGISGASRSGKTLLTNKLFENIKKRKSCQVLKLSQDRYFADYRTILVPSERIVNWDCPAAISWDIFYNDIIKARDKLELELVKSNVNCFLIVEGFMCFYEKRLRDLFDFMIWLEINEPTCYRRRMGTFPVTDRYFNTYLWPNYIQYRILLFDEVKAPMFVIDGQLNTEIILQTAEEVIRTKS